MTSPSRLAQAIRLPRHLLPSKEDEAGHPSEPWAPTAPQAAFLCLSDKEVMYGGAAGGGKSDALLVAALQYVDVPGYTALILRKTFADLSLPDAIMDRAKRWLQGLPGVWWSEKYKTFTFEIAGRQPATLTFGFLQKPTDHLRYQGSAFQFIGFDELTQFPDDQYRYLFSRLRKPEGMPVPLRMRSASNPGGPGHDWVAARFNLQPDPITGERQLPPGKRRFIPAKLSDNPHLDQEAYTEALMELGPIELARLLHGDWGARPPGEMFDREDVRWFEYGQVPKAPKWVRVWDLASTAKRKANQDPDWTVGILAGRTEDDRIVIADVRRFRKDPGDTQAAIIATALQDGSRVHVRMEQEPGSSGKFVIADFATKLALEAQVPFEGKPSTGSKTERARPYASYWKAGKVLLPRATSWVEDFLSEHEAFPQESTHDDQVDASSQAFAELGGLYTEASGAGPAPQRGSQSPYASQRRGIMERGNRHG